MGLLSHLTYIKDVVWHIQINWNNCIKAVWTWIVIEDFKVALHNVLIGEDWGQRWVEEKQSVFALQNMVAYGLW